MYKLLQLSFLSLFLGGGEWTWRVAFVFKVFSCEIKNFHLAITVGTFSSEAYPSLNRIQSRRATCRILLNTPPSPPFLFSKTLVLQTLMRANAATLSGCLSHFLSLFLFFLPPCFSSPLCISEAAAAAESYGQACAEPGNNGMRFLTFPPIKVAHKRRKPPRFNRREILKTPDKWTSPNECIMYGSTVCLACEAPLPLPMI